MCRSSLETKKVGKVASMSGNNKIVITKPSDRRLTSEEIKYLEFLQDCQQSPRLTYWEVGFLSNLITGWNTGRVTEFSELSPKQHATAKSLENKIYAVG